MIEGSNLIPQLRFPLLRMPDLLAGPPDDLKNDVILNNGGVYHIP